MKLLHLGDLHIGKALGDFDLYDDQEYILNQIIKIAEEKKVDMIMLAGDIYDKAMPSEAAVRLLDKFICELAEKKFKVFVISGNHDSDERLNFGSSLFEANNIYICAKNNGVLYKKTFEDEFGKINIFLMPFVKASYVKRFYPDAEINTYDEAVRVLIENSDVNKDERNVLVAHQFVTGKSEALELGGSEGISVKNVGNVEKIGADCFDLFDYVALGHIHSGQRVGRDEVRYSGSPLKYSLSEANNNKSVPIVTINEKGQVEIELVKLVPKRDLRHIKGKMEQLLDKNNISAPEDFIYVTLTDDEPFNDAMGIFQQVYPNTVKIDYDNLYTKQIEQIDITNITKDKSFDDMITDFYEKMYCCKISEDELKLMKEIAREVGVLDETN